MAQTNSSGAVTQEAYETLSDSAKKAKYDRSGYTEQQAGSQSGVSTSRFLYVVHARGFDVKYTSHSASYHICP